MDLLWSEIKNNSLPVAAWQIPVLKYEVFYGIVEDLLKDETKHCVSYYCSEKAADLNFYCCIADDSNGSVYVLEHALKKSDKLLLKSLTTVCPQLHIYEREIHENHGVEFEGHPWLKPVRYPDDRSGSMKMMGDYPFYEIESEELHEVGVGPVHAGVIEPGHFRFICNGEKVLHLEIQLGYQHRGIEKLILAKNRPLQRCLISESIAGDTSVGHSLAHAQLIESLGEIDISERLQIERCIALELERMAVHLGDTAALCGDVAYQLGQVVCEALRTGIINTTQLWCGNRFGKGLIRPGGSNFPLNNNVAEEILRVVADTAKRFGEITDRIYSLPSVLARYEDIGIVTKQQVSVIGAVGMAARTSGLLRDLRKTHPFQYFKSFPVEPLVQSTGDVLARGLQRKLEVSSSGKIISELIDIWHQKSGSVTKPVYNYLLKPYSYSVSLVEGWRGEICHTATTGENGDIEHYKIKDPSFHNWLALALAVRNQEISDFPLCNKSFNLSYCGHDL